MGLESLLPVAVMEYRDNGFTTTGGDCDPRGSPRYNPGPQVPAHRRTASEIESLIVKVRIDNPRWGARIIHTKLAQAGLTKPPVVSTIHRVLQRHGLIVAQQHRAPKE